MKEEKAPYIPEHIRLQLEDRLRLLLRKVDSQTTGTGDAETPPDASTIRSLHKGPPHDYHLL